MGKPLLMNPITGIAFCCARAARGHAIAVLPRMKRSRRFNRSPSSWDQSANPTPLLVYLLAVAPKQARCWRMPLQAAMTLLRSRDFGVELKFGNYR